jgi:hypothetical protein
MNQNDRRSEIVRLLQSSNEVNEAFKSWNVLVKKVRSIFNEILGDEVQEFNEIQKLSWTIILSTIISHRRGRTSENQTLASHYDLSQAICLQGMVVRPIKETQVPFQEDDPIGFSYFLRFLRKAHQFSIDLSVHPHEQHNRIQ